MLSIVMETVWCVVDLGWNEWIIQPQGFETGFCAGTCNRYTLADDFSKVILTGLGETCPQTVISDWVYRI